jgi:hypothetical protein
MARHALIFVTLGAVLALAACQSDQDRLSAAISSGALVRSEDPLPDLPGACTAAMKRAYPKASEPWVVTQRRWEFLAVNRDGLSNDCKAWWDTYRMERKGAGL